MIHPDLRPAMASPRRETSIADVLGATQVDDGQQLSLQIHTTRFLPFDRD